jgi:hypothetical protein
MKQQKDENESTYAARVLGRVLSESPSVSGVMPRDLKAALNLAISLLTARGTDEGVTENEQDWRR